MAKYINSLLNKKSWTGVEVGKALVMSIVHDIKHQSEPDYKPLFSQNDFYKMESSLSTEQDYLTYSVYKDIYNGIIKTFNKGERLYQQFNHGYYRYLIYLKDAQKADMALNSAEHIPYVMTEEQYSKLKEQAKTGIRAYTESFNSLFFTILSVFIKDPKDAPETIIDTIESTKKEIVKKKHILKSYNEVYWHGYYQLADGTRSDQIKKEIWKERIKRHYLKKYVNNDLNYNIKRYLKGFELFFNGIEYIKNIYLKHTGKEIPQKEEKGIMQTLENLINFRDTSLITDLESGTATLDQTLTYIKILLEGELENFPKWHYYTDLPTSITKYDIIANSLCIYNGEISDEKEPKLKEFKADYPALYKAIEAYIKKIVPKANKLKPEQYSNSFISWGELADLGIQKYITLTTPDEYDIAENLAQKENEENTENLLTRSRILFNGIVIAKEPKTYHINERGEYIDNIGDILAITNQYSLDSLTRQIKIKEIIVFQENLFKQALRYIYAFNDLIKILGDIYNIEGMDKLENTTQFESQLDDMNNLIYIFYGEVYGTEKEKIRKRKLIKYIFIPINYEELKPTQKAIEAVTAELDKLGFSSANNKLKNFESIIEKLCDKRL